MHLVSDVLDAAGQITGFATTVDFKQGDHVWQNETRQSTQEAVEVQEFFAELLVAGGTWGVLEATSHALALRKLRGVEVDVAVFTNLSPEHLDFHGTLQKYLDAKGELFAMLPLSFDKGVAKTAVLNADDSHWRYLADRAGSASVMTYGIDALADVQGTVLASDAAGSRLRIAAHGASVEFTLPLVGRFNVHSRRQRPASPLVRRCHRRRTRSRGRGPSAAAWSASSRASPSASSWITRTLPSPSTRCSDCFDRSRRAG